MGCTALRMPQERATPRVPKHYAKPLSESLAVPSCQLFSDSFRRDALPVGLSIRPFMSLWPGIAIHGQALWQEVKDTTEWAADNDAWTEQAYSEWHE